MTREAVLDMESWDFEQDLANIASKAALELDNLILNRLESLDGVRNLRECLAHSLTDVSDPGGPQSRLDPTTVVVVNFAFADSSNTARFSTLNELLEQADLLKRSLSDLLEHPADFKQQRLIDLEKLRDFCVALAKRALSIAGPHIDEHPDDAYRR